MLQKLFPLIAAILANSIAQLLKPIFHYFKTKTWDWSQVLESGGFPSSHTSLVIGLAFALGLQSNFLSNGFFIALVFSFTVIYDAANVRYYSGQNIRLTKQLIQDVELLMKTNFENPIYQEKVKLVLGHKWVEVFGGILLGLVTTYLLYLKIG